MPLVTHQHNFSAARGHVVEIETQWDDLSCGHLESVHDPACENCVNRYD